jgi:hypothetical protein
LLLFLILFAVLPASIYRPDAPLPGKASLEEKAFNLSKKGIDETNQAQAIDILLRLTTNNYEVGKPEGIRVRFVPQIITLLIVDLGLFIFGRLCPRSVLGIGLGCRTIHRYQIIGKCIYVLFGLWIFAIGTSAIGSWLYDLIKGSSS